MTSKPIRILELGDIIKTATPPKKIQTSEFLERGDYPIIDQSPLDVAGWTNDETALVHPPKNGLIVFGDHTCVLKFVTNSFAQGADGIKIIEIKNDINPHYVYAHLKAFPLLNDGYKRHFSELKRLKIILPDSSTQGYISEVLHLIDSKIASNIALSRTLVEIAQAIFKSWFIDFDPVHAKKNGEKISGIDTETAKLFPDSFVNSELGDIPKGWNVVKFESLGKIVTGKTPSTKNEAYWGGDVPFVTIPDMTKNRFTISAERYLSKLGADSQKNQYLPKGVTSVSCIASPGLVSYSFVESQTNQQINSVIPNSGIPCEWLFFRIDSEIHQIKSRSGIGSVFSNLNKSGFSSLETIFASKELHEKFSEIAAPMLLEIETTTRANQKLIQLRDSLLPRLISGELQIPEEMFTS